jgi:hypothetical protein
VESLFSLKFEDAVLVPAESNIRRNKMGGI